MLSELIKMCLVSAVFRPIKIEGREVPLRAQINLLVEAPFGSGKTYLIETLRQKELGIIMDRWTENAFYGSISRAGAIIPPVTILGAGKTILIDEFQTIPSKFKVPLLKLLEEQVVNRQLLHRVEAPVKLEKEFYSLEAKEGYLFFHIRASYLIVTSHLSKKEIDKMLMSRCITVRLDFTVDDLYTGLCKLDSKELEKVKELREELKNYQGEFTEKEDKEFLDLVVEELTQSAIPHNFAYRIRDNLIRIENCIRAGVVSKYKVEDFLPVILAGILGIRLRPVELEVYGKLENLNNSEKAYADELVRKGLCRIVCGKYVRCCNFKKAVEL